MKKVALSEIKDELFRFLRLAAKEEVVITRHGKAAGVLIGFESEEDWFEYRLEKDPRFLYRVEVARANLRAKRGVKLEDLGKAESRARDITQRSGTARGKKTTARTTRSRR